MGANEQLDRVWDIIEQVGVCMLTTRFAGGLRARPLQVRPEREAGLIWFVTDLHSGKEEEIETEHDVGLVFIDAKEKAYLSITARAEVLRDRSVDPNVVACRRVDRLVPAAAPRFRRPDGGRGFKSDRPRVLWSIHEFIDPP